MKRKAPSPPSFLDDNLLPPSNEPENLDHLEPFIARKRRRPQSDFENPEWPQLKPEYQSFTQSITDSGTYFPNIHPIILKLLDRFDAEDGRERAALGTLLMAIYNRFPQHRIFIRESVYHVFCEFNSSSGLKHNGIPELLDFIGKVVEKRESVYLEDEFRVFLLKSLIPLYKSKWLVMFYPNLRNCVSKFIVKDGNLTDSVFQGIKKFWPKQGSSREYFFLDAIEFYSLKMKKDLKFTSSILGLLEEKIASCVSSPQFVVARKALFLLNPNGGLKTLIRSNFKEILPIVFPRLKEAAAEHWRLETRELAGEISLALKKIDPVFFDDCYIASMPSSEDEDKTLKLKRETSESSGIPSKSQLSV